jgi:hypothetical protein
LQWCAGVPVRRACRTGTVSLAVELIEGHGAGGERAPGRDARMLPGSGTGMARLPAGCLRTASDPGPGGGRQPGIIEQAGVPAGGRMPVNVAVEPARCGSGPPGYRRVRLPGASRPVMPSR